MDSRSGQPVPKLTDGASGAPMRASLRLNGRLRKLLKT
jgi:hypothetical protein